MQASEYEKGALVGACWRLSRTGDVNELLAIACTIRNWVVPRPGKTAVFKCYGDAVNYFLSTYPVRDLPTGNEPSLVDLNEGLLTHIDKVYDNTMPDITSSREFSGGAHSFGPSGAPPASVHNPAAEGELIGMFGGQKFYGRRG